MELAAVTHIAGDNYCYPINDNELVIKIKTGYAIDRIELVYGDPFESGLAEKILGAADLLKWAM